MIELGKSARMEKTESIVLDENLVLCHVQVIHASEFSYAGNVSNVFSISFKRVPLTFSQSSDSMIARSVSTTQEKELLQYLHETGALNAAFFLRGLLWGVKWCSEKFIRVFVCSDF